MVMNAESDLTGRARIRHAALVAFVEEGDAASIRGIAGRAGCSPALVQHHFGRKEDLRDACDDYVLAYFREQVTTGVGERGIADADYVAELYRTAPAVIHYLNRRLVENSAKAQWFFDELVAMTEPYLAEDMSTSVRDRAAVLVAMKLGVQLLRPYLDSALGIADDDAAGNQRIGAAQLDLFAADLASAAVMDAARKATRSEVTA